MGVLNEVDEKMGLVESILTKTENIIKKHWKLLILIVFAAFIYWAFNLPPVEPPQQQEQQVQDTLQFNQDTTTWE